MGVCGVDIFCEALSCDLKGATAMEGGRIEDARRDDAGVVDYLLI